MFTTADKVSRSATTVPRQSAQPFFARKHDSAFFSGTESAAPTSFIQPKLSVSHPDDPQEKEADSMANKVMTMPEPAAATSASDKKEEIQRKEEGEKEVQRSADDKEHEVQRSESPVIQMKEEQEEVQRAADEQEVQRKEEQEETAVQRAAEKEEEKVHTKLVDSGSSVSGTVIQTKCASCEQEKKVDRKIHTLPHSYTIQRSARGPPQQSAPSFEQNLQSTRSIGNPMPDETRTFMESRFSADFSGVRVHTGETAVQMNRKINAQPLPTETIFILTVASILPPPRKVKRFLPTN